VRGTTIGHILPQIEELRESSSATLIEKQMLEILDEATETEIEAGQAIVQSQERGVDYFVQDDGLILSTLNLKRNKLQVISEFILKSQILGTGSYLYTLANDRLSLVSFAIYLRELQEREKPKNKLVNELSVAT